MREFKACVIIPVYNHSEPLKRVVAYLASLSLPCILVDDGSDQTCKEVMFNLAKEYKALCTVVTHPINRGKGAACKTGFYAAYNAGYTHAAQVDADGQHMIEDVQRFLDAAQADSQAFVVGVPQFDDSVPRVRFYFRYLTHVWVWINTLSFAIKDSMCGYRVYPLKETVNLLQDYTMGDRMEFDTEVLVFAVWNGLRIKNLDTFVKYPEDGVSHFRIIEDNARISLMHAKLFFLMLFNVRKILRNRI